MLKVTFSILTAATIGVSSMLLSACENSDFLDCKNKASVLWDSKTNDHSRNGNKAYWDAIDQCKFKYQ